MQGNQVRWSQGRRQHPTASADCRHIAGPTVGLSTWGAPPRQAPRCVTHTERRCVDSRQLQGDRRGPPSLRPDGVDSPCGGLPGSHPPQRQGLMGPSTGQALAWQNEPTNNIRACWAHQLGRHAHQAKCLPCHNRGLTPGIQQLAFPQARNKTTRHSMHTSSSPGRSGSRPTFLCPVA